MSTRGRTRMIPGPAMPLLDRNDSVLVVIDLQPRFWGDRLDAEDRRRAKEAAARAAGARTLADAVAFEAANPGLASPPGFSL